GRVPPAAQAITIVALAFVAVAGTMWKPGGGGATEEATRPQLVRTAFAAPSAEAPVATETFAQPAQDAPATTTAEAAPARTEIIPPDPFADEEERENRENQRRVDLTTA